ncbi:hypothetical protein BRE01_26260 [Brevibacillus reuszeri]|uniref:Uncharacterized protein n=1 Tax=Brevibacillus reuszeri TaxID=54915 RepID=A0A0K9YM70_9BACL|nr:hypothetical protein [Brevibacillus reuszeri]KNB69742.1 hypothetical protein ADS79_28250 [Brevibacillus reuszeri]MED1858084.1 hypothetical protein [Brevibacillus reuszeri]GED68924.1 hypothetical protein BRE01_26260 [Brevibacillus reuszeri]GIO05301.1 hypothetical protein J31TS6_13290 [Brevibacillus reuszeri]
MFGFGKKANKLDGIDVLIIKTVEAKNRNFYQVVFPSVLANDILSMLQKLEKSKMNQQEFLGEIGGFRIVTHLEAMTNIDILDDADLEARPVHIEDFANILLRRLEHLEESGKMEESEDMAFIMGELTMLRDGSYVPQN